MIVLLPQVLRVFAMSDVLFRIDIKALGVSWKSDGGNDGTSVFPVVDSVPVNALEEGMCFDARCAALDVS